MAEPLPRRVLMTADGVGGVWDYALELARGLSAHGVAVDLAVLGPPLSERQRTETRAIAGLELQEGGFRLEWMDDAADDLARAGDWLLGLARARRPDLVHLNGYALAALPWSVPVLVVTHSCVASWWRGVHGAPPPARWVPYVQRVRQRLHAADLVVAPTRALLAVLHDIYGPLPRARVIANGRDPARYRPGPKAPFVLSAGRLWDEAKNFAVLDAAAGDLDWPVIAAGRWHPPAPPAQGDAAPGVPPPFRTLRCLGPVPPNELAAWYRRAAVFALPARYEPFGLAVLEAALSGCALVLGDIATLRELWGGVALFVPPDDPARLRAALAGLIADPARRQALAEAARRRAQRYTAARMVAAYGTAYAALMASRTCAVLPARA